MSVFIVFEGADRVGKTSHLRRCSQFLKENGIDHICTQELSGSEFQNSIKQVLMNHDLNTKEELLLISCLRNWHDRCILKPALAANKWVLMDRYKYSTYAYQQASDEYLNTEILKVMEQYFWSNLEPNMVFYFKGTARSNNKRDRFEKRSACFFKKVKEIYESLQDDRWSVFSTDEHFECIQQKLEVELSKKIKNYKLLTNK